jgi:blue copper oxidase
VTRRHVTRRTVLKAALIGVPSAAAAVGGGMGWLWAAADVSTAGRVRFANRLAIPPLAASHRDASGRRVFNLRAAPGKRRLRPGRATATWGVNGPHLGPTLRATRGETVLVNLRNDLPETTTVHWHGMHLPARMDGNPHQPIRPRTTWSPTWTIDQPAATLWYHPHPHQRTARHAYRGMAGMFILDDPDAAPHGLPSRYGVDDIPVIVQDIRLDDDNQLDERKPMMGGVGLLGSLICVNGTPAPYHEVATERIRLRLLNASNARVYRFGFADDRTFSLIGTDGGLLAAPYETTRVQLSPGERAEIVVTLRPGERTVLRSHQPDLGVNLWDHRFSGGDDTLDILELRAARRLAPSPPLPDRLAEAPQIAAATAAVTRTFQLAGFSINGQRMDMSRIDFAVTKGSTEVWEVTALDGTPHNFHVHDVQFQVLSVGGKPPPPELRGWKDTVHTPPKVPVRIAMRFRDHADRDVPYMYHCHLLYHEDQGLMGQFAIVEPGHTPGTPDAHHHG